MQKDVNGRSYKISYKDVLPVNCLNLLKNLFTKKQIDKLEFTPYAWAKINCYINLIGDLEITGLGKVEDGVITDVTILEQSVNSVHVYCKDTAISDFLRSIDPREAHLWCLDWHSHVMMGVSPSKDDEDNYLIMSEIRLGESFPVMIINKRQDIFCADYCGNGVYKPIEVEYPELISEQDIKNVYRTCKQDIIDYVQERVSVYTYPQSYNAYNGYNAYSGYNSNLDEYMDESLEEAVAKQSDETYLEYLEQVEEAEYQDQQEVITEEEYSKMSEEDRRMWMK